MGEGEEMVIALPLCFFWLFLMDLQKELVDLIPFLVSVVSMVTTSVYHQDLALFCVKSVFAGQIKLKFNILCRVDYHIRRVCHFDRTAKIGT